MPWAMMYRPFRAEAGGMVAYVFRHEAGVMTGYPVFPDEAGAMAGYAVFPNGEPFRSPG